MCRQYQPTTAAAITGVAVDDIVQAARTLWHSRPVAFYAWSGIEQQSNATQIVRAIAQLYALTGSLDAPGGNVLFASVPANPVEGSDLLSDRQRLKALGLVERPLGPSRFEFVTSDEIYTAILESQPYRVSGLVGFGANLLMAQPDGTRGRRALAALDFFVHADLFMNPTAELADIVLPVATPFETEALRVGFEISQRAQAFVQLRKPLMAPLGEARGDMAIVFDLATRMGFGTHFWNGDIEAAWRHRLGPSGVTLERLRADPAGVQVALETRHRKFVDAGFETPSRKIEFYSEILADHGYPPLPDFAEPLMSPLARPDLATRFPLVLTCAKSLWYCETQHRGLPSLRRHAADPEVELHPETAHARGIGSGDWVHIESPHGKVRARAKLNRDLHPDVVCGQHGWWQACAEIGAPGFDPFGPESANFNLLITHRPADPISGGVPMRSYICEVTRLEPASGDYGRSDAGTA